MKSFSVFLVLILLATLWLSMESPGLSLLMPITLAVSAVYIFGLIRLWRRAGVGHGLPVWRAACFLGGMTILGLSLSGFMDKLADEAFSMHMVQHMLLMKVVAPLLLLGEFSSVFLWAIGKNVAHQAAGKWSRLHWLRPLWKHLTDPWVAWTLYALFLWGWHIPVFYQAALNSEPLHDLEHLMFLGSSLLFWWYLLKTGPGRVVRFGMVILYLFTTLLHESLLGWLLTFSSRAWYSFYSAPVPWGLSPLGDQQLAGMIMWLPGGVLFAFLIVVYFGVWLQAIEKRMQGTHPEFVPTGDSNE